MGEGIRCELITWEQVQRLFEESLRRPLDERGSFLNETCANNPDLRHELESLLQHHHEASTGFMEPVDSKLPYVF